MSRVIFAVPISDAGAWCPVCGMAMMERVYREQDAEIKKAQEREGDTPVIIKVVPQLGELLPGEVYALAPGLESLGGGLYKAGPNAIGVPPGMQRGRG